MPELSNYFNDVRVRGVLFRELINNFNKAVRIQKAAKIKFTTDS